MQDKALELQGREGHREMANPEESQDMEQQVWKTRGPVDAQATHKGASLELQVMWEVALEEPDLEDLALHMRYILELVEYISEPQDILELEYISEEPQDTLELEYTSEPEDTLELEYISEPELRDIPERQYTSEPEEVELCDSGQHALGALPL